MDETDTLTYLENRTYLVLLLATIALTARLLAWPLFYIQLQSFIPQIPGAMCIFGVTQASPLWTAFLEVLKPIVFFLLGTWFVLYFLNRSTGKNLLMKKVLLFLGFMAFPAAVDAFGEIIMTVTYSPPGIPVSCCTMITDIQIRPTAIIPKSILGDRYASVIMVLYHVWNLLLVILIGFSLKRRIWEEGSRKRACWLVSLFVAGLVNMVITYFAMVEVIGPRLMHLDHHHCLYCLIQYLPHSLVFLGLFLLAVYALGWALFIIIFAKVDGIEPVIADRIKELWRFAFYALLISWMMVTVHLAVLMVL